MRIILSFILLVCSTTWCQTFLNIKDTSGVTHSFNIADINKLTFDGVVSIDESRNLFNVIKSFSLIKSYPNPFNPSTTLEFQLPGSGSVELRVFDITGRLLLSHVKNYTSAGNVTYRWDSKDQFGHDVPSGIYLIQVKYKNSILTKKIMKLK